VDEEGLLGQVGEAAMVVGVAEAVAEMKDRCISKGSVCCGRCADSCTATSVIMEMLAHARALPEDAVPNYAALKCAVGRAVVEITSHGAHAGSPQVGFDWEDDGIKWSSIDGSLRLESYTVIASS
jgi:hypothetical protein